MATQFHRLRSSQVGGLFSDCLVKMVSELWVLGTLWGAVTTPLAKAAEEYSTSHQKIRPFRYLHLSGSICCGCSLEIVYIAQTWCKLAEEKLGYNRPYSPWKSYLLGWPTVALRVPDKQGQLVAPVPQKCWASNPHLWKTKQVRYSESRKSESGGSG